MRVRNFEDFAEFDAQGKLLERTSQLKIDKIDFDAIARTLSEISATPTTTPGNLSGTEEGDVIAVELVAGQTYTFDYRGVNGGVVDPYLGLFNSGFGLIAEDDDGGRGTSSMITYTPTASGTYYLYATSFTVVSGGSPADDFGDYTINIWSPEADVPGSTNVTASIATAVEIGVGTTFGNLDAAGDNDYFAVDVQAGMVYSFNYNGGVSSAADFNNEPGENIGVIRLYDAAGGLLAPAAVNYETGVGYFAQQDATIYVRVSGFQAPMTGGYTLDVSEIDPADKDPLDAIRWKSANNVPAVDTDGDGVGDTVYVYFGSAAEGGFGETESLDDYPPGTPITTYGWEAHQVTAVMSSLAEYTPITGITYVQTTDLSQATFRLVTTINDDYGARFYPQDPSTGAKQGLGIFNLASGGFGADPNSLLPGGFAYAVILHEFGHAHGLAHPHDTGGGSDVMLGVSASTGSYGIYNLNQGVYTVMSYNDGWPLSPDGPRPYAAATRGSGWSETLGAFDIAALQERYGVHASATGNDTYTIADAQADSQYRTIWDTAGNDTIAYAGTRNAQIDLLAATLDYTPTGGGVVSFAQGVWGGFTIANSVVIENATGGSGNDTLLGNASANILTGNDGNDSLMGRSGNDQLRGGLGVDTVYGGDGIDVANLGGGNDIFVAEVTASKVALKGPQKGNMSVDIITDFDGAGDDKIDVSDLGSFTFRGTNANKNAGDLTYKTYDSINGAEGALGFDIDGQAGASGVGGKVTVVYGNTDGGAADFAIILLNTSSVDASDFMFT